MPKIPKILVLGISGMLGSALFRHLQRLNSYIVFGALRNSELATKFKSEGAENVISGLDIESSYWLDKVFCDVQPDVVINCIGAVKQISDGNEPLRAIPINSLLPHRLALLCQLTNARLIHFSTDCVFSGKKGNYLESDECDARDVYGLSKHMGEVVNGNSLTLRTSLIGHELRNKSSLLEWFLAQETSVRGYKNAIFSGLPAGEIALVLEQYVLPNAKLKGLYHLSVNPISKYDLLKIIAKQYKKDIEIIEDTSLVIDRSLNSEKFRVETGYRPKDWIELVSEMYCSNPNSKGE